ncbi:apolipoprotein N-acyltransferase [Craurococcus roseus]|uniref:Apolipoprotein N-acyltransferase n=1 Tax=Craurococcus roseus TaxID=77585 RepID=A0ABN1EQI4_9PROT
MFAPFFASLSRLPARPALATAFGLGLLSALALPPIHAVPVLLVAFPGLLALAAGRDRTWRGAALVGFAWGWGHHLAGIYWVTHAILTDVETWWWLVPLAAPGLAIPLALFAVPPVLAARALPAGWPRVLGFAGVWVFSEMARGVLFTGFPWNLIGSVWAFDALPVQGAALVGVHGLSLATVLLACLPLLGRVRPLMVGAAAVAAAAALGAWRMSEPPPPAAAPGPRLVLVQGNIAQQVKWREDQRVAIFQRYLDMTAEAARRAAVAEGPGDQPSVVAIWPETASPFLLAQDPEAKRLIAETLPPGGVLLAGTIRGEWGEDRILRRVFNSLVALDDEGEVAALADKFHLVPFGEYMPLAGLIPIRMVVGGMDFSAGPGPETMSVPGLPPFGALICYEVIFPGAVTPTPRPAWLLNITNDAWFGFSSGPWQHLAAARMRAAEEGLPLVRAAQTGISAVFDAQGRRLAFLPLGTAGTLDIGLPGALPPTPFGRFGLLIPGALAGLCLLAAFAAVHRASRRVVPEPMPPTIAGRL